MIGDGRLPKTFVSENDEVRAASRGAPYFVYTAGRQFTRLARRMKQPTDLQIRLLLIIKMATLADQQSFLRCAPFGREKSLLYSVDERAYRQNFRGYR